MPIYNVVKKMNKAAERLGFAPGERAVAGCITFPQGHKLKSMIQMGAGGPGPSLSRTGQAAASELASRMPNGQHLLAITDRRLIATTVRAVSTNPKDLVAEWTVDEIRDITVQRHAPASAVMVTFVDGSVLTLDGMHGSGAGDLHQVLAV